MLTLTFEGEELNTLLRNAINDIITLKDNQSINATNMISGRGGNSDKLEIEIINTLPTSTATQKKVEPVKEKPTVVEEVKEENNVTSISEPITEEAPKKSKLFTNKKRNFSID